VLFQGQHGARAGTASALMGTLQFVVGATVMAVVGVFVDGTARPMVAGIAGSALMALAFSAVTLAGRQDPASRPQQA